MQIDFKTYFFFFRKFNLFSTNVKMQSKYEIKANKYLINMGTFVIKNSDNFKIMK